MTNTETQTLPLAADFPPATGEDWRRLVDTALKGAPFERLFSKTYDGLTIAPLYERAASASPVPGRSPGAAWTLMQRVDHPDPAAANVQALTDLENGATGLLLVFAGAPSANGFGLDPSPAALKRVLDGIHLDAGVAIELDLSAQSRQVVRNLADLIASRGLAPSTVNLRTGFNVIGGFAVSGSPAAAWDEIAPHMAEVIAKVAGAGFLGPFVAARSRNLRSLFLARSPICARSKEAAWRSRMRATPYISGSQPTWTSFSPPPNSARCESSGRGSNRPAALRRSGRSSRPRPPGA
jgi:methylmalonyl-CoA mutase